MMQLFRLAASGLITTAAFASMVQAQPMNTGGHRPVMLSVGDDGLDPCAMAVIVDQESLSPDGGGAILVFPGDSTDLDYIDTLVNGEQVWVCDASSDMVGVVYTSNAALDCEVTTPVSEDRPYLGPCDWGWVKQEWVQVIAG